ncbi:MAG: hypothetical protein KGQ78_09685 [Acidobacteria bacterium]|nr:hypothetical protein [Acidobacteriota bacterium]
MRSALVIVAAVVIANGAYLLLGYESSPLWWTAGITSRSCLWTCGLPTVDPSVGFITQPLGHAAAMDLIHGHLPWWNYFEGMGQPLAGEMQAAALFPLVILFILPAGLLFFHVTLEVIAGLSTYLLLRRLGVRTTLATLGGLVFALNGTFAWIGNAVVNPVAFLPMLLLGVEVVTGRDGPARRAGWTLVAVALAMSIYAGFPEVAYLDTLLAVGWALTRLGSLERTRRREAAAHLLLGGGVGLAISLPVLVAFGDFARVANLGQHATSNTTFATATTPLRSLALLVNPYLGGTLLGGTTSAPSGVLGYVTASVAVFAIVGAVGARLRPLRLFLVGWLAAVLAGVLNILEVRRAWNLIPFVRQVSFTRYIWPTVELAAIVLAILGLSDLIDLAARRRRAGWAMLIVSVVALAGLVVVTPWGGHSTGTNRAVVTLMILVPFAGLVTLAAGLRFAGGRAFSRLAVSVIALESLVFFAVPTYRSPISTTVHATSIRYLQQHLGTGRFISLGVLSPNWGSQYSINEINAIDLPLPVRFSDYVQSTLDPSTTNPRIFNLPFTVANENDVAAHISAFESQGVAYVLTPRKPLTPSLIGVGLTPVAHDARIVLYRLAHPSAYFTTASGACSLSDVALDRVVASCPRATTLTRRELVMDGWTAHVNGQVVPISSSDGLDETIALPAGTSTVSFDYLPPHERWAGLIAVLGVGGLVTSWLPRRRRSPPRSDAARET